MSMDLKRAPRNSGLSVAESRDLVARADGVLVDWDGCSAIGNRPHADAAAFLQRYADRVAVVSNNSSNLVSDLEEILDASNVRLPPGRVILAGVEALKRAAALAPAKALVLGDARMRAYARNHGVTLVKDNADVVVLLRDTRFSYARLERAANALVKGARLIIANPDRTHPGAEGRVVPETGALLAALGACVDLSHVETEVIGKPAPRLFRAACEAIGVSPERAVMIGDNPDTDIAGAHALGMGAVLVGPASGLSFRDLSDAGRLRSV